MTRYPNLDRLPITPRTKLYTLYGDVSREYRGGKYLVMAIASGFGSKGVPLDTLRLALDDPSNAGGKWARNLNATGKSAMVDALVTAAYRHGSGGTA